MAVLAAFLYFGGNLVQYNQPPALLLPDAVSAYENGKVAPPVLTIYAAPLSGNRDSAAAAPYGWFVRGNDTVESVASMRLLVRAYARQVDPSRSMEGLNPETGLSENTVQLNIDSRCSSGEIVPLLRLLQECGIRKLKFGVRRSYE